MTDQRLPSTAKRPEPASPAACVRRAVGALPVALALGAVSVLSMPAAPVRAQSAVPAVDSAWILKTLAQPAPMRTAFVELRDSPLLKTPLRLSGEYRRPDEATLVREVLAPYRETTTLRAGEATIVRAGKPPRTYSLARVPELADLQGGFGALLAGDRVRLERVYTLSARGDRRRWTLALVPKDKALAARVRDIVLHGQGAELRCIETRPTRGPLQRILLASAARAATPNADAKALETLCRSGLQ